MRIFVLWNNCRGISPDEDARWAHDEVAKLRAVAGVASATLHRVESAALRHPHAWDWLLELELELGNGDAPNSVVREPRCGVITRSDFFTALADRVLAPPRTE